MKNSLHIQSPSAVVMVVPHHFRINPETALDNHFQQSPTSPNVEQIDAQRARAEVETVVTQLRHAGIQVLRFDDVGTDTPDSVFPNNWFSTHADGKLLIYPMYCTSRKKEVRQDIIEALQKQFCVTEIIDLRCIADHQEALEGTGSMVFDHLHQRIYACRSTRTSERLLNLVANTLGYQTVLTDAHDEQQHAIYHTNVMMSIGTNLAIVGDTSIAQPQSRSKILHALRSTRHVITLNAFQISQFSANCLELRTNDQALLAISSSAWNSLEAAQRELIQSLYQTIICAIPSIEKAGGSIRCMLAGIHLPPRTQ